MSFCCVFLLCGDWEGKLPQLTVGNFTDSWLFLHLLPSFGSGLRRFPQESGFFVIIGGLNCYFSSCMHAAHPHDGVIQKPKLIAGLFVWLGVKCFVVLTLIPKREQLCIANRVS